MTRTPLTLLSAGAALWLTLSAVSNEKTHKITTISPRKMADALHSVIAADRQAYAEMAEQRVPEDARRHLPVHAQLLRTAGQRIQQRGAEFSYTLRSLWPINPSYGPQTQVEQAGLERLANNPGENYYVEEELGGRSYFTAIYPDRATLRSCVECHNQHPSSPRHNFKLGDVMGAIVVRVPLEF